MGIRTAGVTHPGKENKLNQDIIYAKTWIIPDREVGVIAVADGMGGYANGEIAAQTAIKCLDNYFEEAFAEVRPCHDADKLNTELDAVFLAAHKKIMLLNSAAGDKSGTTLTVCILHGTDYIVKNIGDTRCYLLSSAGIQQISIDDSWVAEQVRIGTLTEYEARKHDKQNLLTRCLGVGSDTVPHSTVRKLSHGQILAVCSDGFYKALEPEEISSAILQWRDRSDNPLNLVLPTLFKRDETDNISLCLMC